MREMTVNDIIDTILDISGLQNLNQGRKIGRKERISALFPQSIVAFLSQRSPSYLSWFLNDDKRGDPVKDYVGSRFDDNPSGFLREMTLKCEVFLDVDGDVRTISDRLGDLINRLGMHNPLFVRGSAGAENLAAMAKAAPSRVLAVLLLDASTRGLTNSRYEKILSCWHLMDREIIEISRTAPEKAIVDGEILYADGHRIAAMKQFEKALELLEDTTKTVEKGTLDKSEQNILRKRLLMRMGNMYLQGDGCDADKVHATLCFEECAALGCPEADYQLGLLQFQDGYLQKAKELFLRGAESGDVSCLRMLGNAFFIGEALVGGEKDLSLAVTYFLSGANQEDISSGDAYCQYMVGRILEDNQKTGTIECSMLTGKEADPEYWFEAAAGKGHRDSAAALNWRRWTAYGNIPPQTQFFSGNTHNDYFPDRDILEQENSDSAICYGRNTGNSVDSDRNVPASQEKDNSRKKYCLLNSFSGENYVFARSLPDGEYIIYVCTGESESGGIHDNAHHELPKSPDSRLLSIFEKKQIELRDESVPEMLYHIFNQHIKQEKERTENKQDNPSFLHGVWETFPEVLLMMLSENEQLNIRDGLQALRTAFFLHNEMGTLLARHDAGMTDDLSSRMFYLLSDRLRLYVLGNDSVSAPLFDSTCGRLEGFYIPLFLCDHAKMVSMSILEQMPLFLPCLKSMGIRSCTPKELRMDIAVFGDHPGIVQLCKDAIAVSQIEDIPFSLTVIDENADKLEKKFLAECPGIAHPPQGVAVHKPEFLIYE